MSHEEFVRLLGDAAQRPGVREALEVYGKLPSVAWQGISPLTYVTYYATSTDAETP